MLRGGCGLFRVLLLGRGHNVVAERASIVGGGKSQIHPGSRDAGLQMSLSFTQDPLSFGGSGSFHPLKLSGRH
jgi:hypothetical protein